MPDRSDEQANHRSDEQGAGGASGGILPDPERPGGLDRAHGAVGPGAGDPAEADEGTIRKEYAESKAKNAVHGSDSDSNAIIEGISRYITHKIQREKELA